MRRIGLAASLTFTMAAAILTGCGGAQPSVPGDRISGTTLTIYASVPMHGPSRFNAQSVLNGAQLALAQARGTVGKYQIVLKPLDDSTPQRNQWDPGQTTLNARLAVQDGTTIGYIGEFNSGASAISIPLLNRLEIPQISPGSTAVGLTSSAAGAAPGEPDKYYPTGIRAFARIVPNDLVQAGVQVKLQQSLGCHKTYVIDDGQVDGEDMADSFELVARSAGLNVVGIQAFQRGASDYAAFAAGIAQSGANCVLISAITDSGAVLVTRQIAAAMPAAKIFGTDGVAEGTFTDPAQGGIPLSLDPRVLITTSTLGGSYEPPAARVFWAAYMKRYGLPQPAAIYGYEAMRLMLAAISGATDHGHRAAVRSQVLDAIFDTRDRQSVLGTYSIDSSGDTTIHRDGVDKIANGSLEFWKAVDG